MTIIQLSDKFIEPYKTLTPPWGPVGEIVYKRTYARLKEDGEREDWWETSLRCVNFVLRRARGAITLDEGKRLYAHMFYLRGTVSGRSMWQMGTAGVETDASSLVNCWVVSCNDPEAFSFTFNQLMLGGGVGFNIQKETVFELPRVKVGALVTRLDTKDANFIVPDSRQGWVELLRRTVEAFFVTGEQFTYSTICVRGRGTPIKGFGGVASGPEDLCKGIEQIQEIFHRRAGQKLRPVDALDIMNIVGMIVVSGNVRRSAEIAAGDLDDHHFLTAKRFDLTTLVPNSRAMSNNSVVCSATEHLNSSFWKTYTVGGEPYGLLNLKLTRKKGRLRDANNWNRDVIGFNPCAEIGLENKEPCNLAEIHAPNLRSIEDFKEVAALLFKVCKLITSLPYEDPEVQAVISKNRRTGVSITGERQAPEWLNEDAQDECYNHLKDVDKEFSQVLGKALDQTIPLSIRMTTIKPSGTSSLLSGVSPGIHPEFAAFYIRRIRMSSDDTLVARCHEAGYHVEPARRFDGQNDITTSVISFPIKSRGGTVAADVTAIEQLERVKSLQTNWSDNAVSCTIYYTAEELAEIQEWLSTNYTDSVKSVSFLLRSEHGFDQAPMEEITEEAYEKMKKVLTPMNLSNLSGGLIDGLECEGGACPIR